MRRSRLGERAHGNRVKRNQHARRSFLGWFASRLGSPLKAGLSRHSRLFLAGDDEQVFVRYLCPGIHPKDDPRQLDAQGGLLCSDWKGEAVASESVLAADD
jgi:hypothetical protein